MASLIGTNSTTAARRRRTCATRMAPSPIGERVDGIDLSGLRDLTGLIQFEEHLRILAAAREMPTTFTKASDIDLKKAVVLDGS